jgi:hypothetical protein
MRPGPVVVERRVGCGAGVMSDRALGQAERLRRVPLLRRDRDRKPERQQRERQGTHAGELTRGLVVAASTIGLAAACAGSGTGPGIGVARADLLAIGRTDATDPAPATFVFKNNELRTFQLRHSDSTQTLFATFTFSPRSIVSRNDTLLCDTCTVAVTVSVTASSYEFTLGPASLVFNETGEPIVEVSFGTYGDASVYTMSSRYATAAAFVQALGVWHERTVDHWVLGRNSTHTGPAAVSSAMEGPGTYLLAAPK